MHIVVIVAIVVVALLVWGAVNAHKAAVARRQALAALARRWGVRFVADVDRQPRRRFPGLSWFARGDDQWLSNTLGGAVAVDGREVRLCAGDFTYEETSTDSDGDRSTRTYNRSYLTLDLGLPTPDLAVRPEGFGDKVKAWFGFADIEFESAEFNRRFHVRCGDKKFAYDVCHARAQQWLLASTWQSFELVDGVLLVPGNQRWDPQDFVAARTFAEALLRQWPAFVWQDLAARQAAGGGREG
ncbi:MAG: hypothetical protein R3F56_17295 [Planctomycetota bacterium]